MQASVSFFTNEVLEKFYTLEEVEVVSSHQNTKSEQVVTERKLKGKQGQDQFEDEEEEEEEMIKMTQLNQKILTNMNINILQNVNIPR